MKKYIKIVLLFLLFISLFIIKSEATTEDFKSYLDNPTGINEVITNKLNISGWVMSENNISINVYINNNYICNIERNEKRPDVLNAIKGYGGEEKNPVPGFNYTLDLSKYEVGTYSLKLEIINRDKMQKIGEMTKQFKIGNIKVKSYIDTPSNILATTNKLTVSGWVMSEGDIQIKAYIDNNYIQDIERNSKRPDVLNAISGYGTSKENPLPGFDRILDISNISNGEHTLKIEVLDKNRNSIIDTKISKFNKDEVRMYIDKPLTNNEKKLDNLEISGWLLSDSNIKINAYINDNFVKEIRRTEKRPDVLNAISGYGGLSKNPNPGFNDFIDISSYTQGTYTLKLEIINKDTSRVIKEEIKTFIVKLPNTKAYIDKPTNNLMVMSSKLDISGWVMSEGNIQIKAYIDDNYIQDIERNIRRSDVLSAISGYGTSKENPLPGFDTTLDIRNIDDGNHILRLEIIKKNTNETIYNSKVNFNKKTTMIELEKPEISNGKIKEKIQVYGWAMSEKNIQIKVYIDNNYEGIIERTKERLDVISAINGCGGIEKNPLPGFDTVIDISNYKSGTHTLKLEVVDINTSNIITEFTRKFNKSMPETMGYIDGYVNNQNVIGEKITVGGWVMSETDIKLNLYFDDSFIQEIERNIKRPDVLSSISGYGGSEKNPTPGFETQIDSLRYKDGSHTLKVEAVSLKTGETIKTIKQNIILKKYDGVIHLESPTMTVLNKDTLEISGWELSKAPNTELEIYFDDDKLEVTRLVRKDIFTESNIQKYGDESINKTPGFTTKVEFSKYNDGNHKIKLILKNIDTGETIASALKNITKYSSIKMGIDVSSYQGSIDWQAVGKSGIEFAMIRAGLRGYGTSSDGVNGKLVEDSYFKANIQGAINNGIDVGVYFFTQAINEQEAIDEANFVLNLVKNYKITYPIAIDTEASSHPNNQGRADGLTVEQRTKVVKAFCNTIKNAGYEPMIYANKWWLKDKLDMTQLSDYSIWLAHYTGATQDNPLEKPSDYDGNYIMWQYTSSGTVDGILGNVDMNVEYKRNTQKIQLIY